MTEQTMVLPSQHIPVHAEVEVAVCGGGPSGLVAAAAAARRGVRTLLIEQQGFLGGMATAGLVGPLSKFSLGGRRIVGGIPWEMVSAMAEKGGARTDLPSGNIPFEAEVYKSVAAKMVRSSGAAILLHSTVIGAVMEDGGIKYVILASPEGVVAVKGTVFIDATGTGELLSSTEVPWRYRSTERQPMSLVFVLGGVDTDGLTTLMAEDGVKYRNTELGETLQRAVDSGDLRMFGGPWTVWGSTLRPGQVSVNATRYAGDVTSARDITAAELSMRDEIETLVQLFRQHRAFRKCYLLHTASRVGYRESRSLIGRYTVCGDDVVSGRDFPDAIALGGHPVDIHRAQSSQTEARFITEPYSIPFRSLVPQAETNLIGSGGIVSADRDAFASIRVQGQCMAIGQAAGTAAALCIEGDLHPWQLDGTMLRETLLEEGAIV